ncbi:hypothetical protein AS156_35730 [Bradyrhizobium macuxiense]|uniref:Beta-lactamase n=1 Tax=Bradyrhizobium macuxiense TaxID=1755647 RepID=A0A109JZS6_9BRAD|nr:hypothetical protein [Bradyrhizobium macuxiense]KWV58166.1 hypothetical protein AS156_35730 [Bradyrhizobium macuxiense]
MKLAIANVLLTFVSGFAKADGLYNGHELFAQCTTNKSFVAGYVAGEIDKAKADYAPMMILFLASTTKPSMPSTPGSWRAARRLVRVIAGVTLGQLTDVFCNYLGDNPASRHEIGAP